MFHDILENWWNSLYNVVNSISLSDFLDIAVLTYLIYIVIKFIRETRAGQLMRGIVVIVAAYFISYFLKLRVINWISVKALNVGVIAIIVLFQPELRRVLERFGTTTAKLSRLALGESDDVVKQWHTAIPIICDSVEQLSRTATGALKIDLALERTAERNAYRSALVALEGAVRDYQRAEDDLKATVRQDMRALSQTREQLAIQSRAVELAARRVRNQDLLLEAGRADMTDLLDAQAALVGAQNSLYRAITYWRSQELALQRDLGTLDATADGVWTETDLVSLGIGGAAEEEKR